MQYSTPIFPEAAQDIIEDASTNPMSMFQEIPDLLSRMGMVNFVVDKSHDETIDLEKKYRVLSQKLLEIYDSEDWFESTLEQLSTR
jgi:hypothetical protein